MLAGHRSAFPSYYVSVSLMIAFTITNSVDPDEMQHYAVFYMGLHCFST